MTTAPATLWSVPRVARLLGLEHRAVRRLELPWADGPLAHRRVSEADLLRWLRGRRRPAPSAVRLPARHFLSQAQTAEALECSISTVRRLRASGRLPWYDLGARTVRILPLDALGLWGAVEEQEQ